MQNKQGYSLWEWLGVMVILLIVAAILFPVFAKSRIRNGHHSCLSNNKWLGLALMQYTQDSDGLMPNICTAPGGKETWRAMLYPYIKSKGIYHCPDDDTPAGPDGFPQSYAANYSGTYNGGPLDKGNGAFAGLGSHPLLLPKFPDPAHLILLCEVQHSPAPEFNIDDPARFGPSSGKLAVRHAGGSNYLLADYHAQWLRPLATVSLWYRNPQKPLAANGIAVLRAAHG